METDPLIGASAGNYTLEGRLGSGGMGDVYAGIQRVVGARVAVKILHAVATRDPEAARRFQIEAQAGNRIEHPGVIKVIDAGQLRDGRPYLVMPLLEGRSLADHLYATPRLPIAEACGIGVDVLDAVAAAHAKGFVHRDLKPPNVFLTSAGRVVILDFGIAKLMSGDSPARLTRTGTAVGTPYYMAPEQIKEQLVGPPSDVYSAGVLLFEMLCGRLPFEGPSAFEVMAGHLEKRPPPPRALRPDIPVAVQEVVLAALAKNPERRFTNAGAMRDALRTAAGIRASNPDLGRAPSGEIEPIGAMGATLRRAPPPATDADNAPTQRRSVPDAGASASGAGASAARPAPVEPAPRGGGFLRVLPWAIAVIALAAAAIVVLTRKDRDAGNAAVPAAATVDAAPAPAPAIDAAVTPTSSIDAVTIDAKPAAPTGAFPRHRARPDARLHDDLEPFEKPDPFGERTPGTREAVEGTAVLESEPPGASVFIDGTFRGITPQTFQLPVGAYRVEMRLDGFADSETTMEISADRLMVVRTVLNKLPE